VTARLAAASPSRVERFVLALMLGSGLYLVKVLHSPIGFTHHDEFLHWRTTREILDHGRLFPENSLLPISPLFSGLENVTTAFASLSGLSIFAAGVLVVGVARLVVMAGLFLFFEQTSGSPQVAGLAVAFYVGNPTFVFFGGMFKYESLALAFFALVLAALARREGTAVVSTRLGLTIVVLLALTAVVVSHHITAYALLGILVMWLFVTLMRRSTKLEGPGVGLIMLAAVLNVGWLLYVASTTVGYLAPLFITAIIEIARLISRDQGTSRELFTSISGEVAPLWHRVVGIGSVLLILIGMPFGLLQAWRGYRDRAVVVVLALMALAYPVTLVLRLAGDTRGWEVAHRSSAFLFVALGFLLALAISELWLARWRHALATVPVALIGSVILIGGMIAGWPPKWNLPGPYLVSASTRSIEPQGIAAAYWARDWLGPDNRIATDGTNYMLMGSYGEQFYVSTLNGGVDSSWVFYAPDLGPGEVDILRRGRIRYLVIDRRLTTQVAMIPPYAGSDPRERNYYTRPLPASLLDKFDRVPGVSRVFDSGDLIIYDVGAITDGT
jgi:hypothetical protein